MAGVAGFRHGKELQRPEPAISLGLDGLERELAGEPQRSLDRDLPVAESGVGKELRLGGFLEVEEGAANALDIFRREFAVPLDEVLAEPLEPLAVISRKLRVSPVTF